MTRKPFARGNEGETLIEDQIIEGAATRSLDFKVLGPEQAAEVKAAYANVHRLFKEKMDAEQVLEKRLRELFGKRVQKNESISFADQRDNQGYAILYRYEVYADRQTKSAHNSLADASASNPA